MKKKWVLRGILIAMSLAGCSKNSVDYDHIVFSKDDLIQSSFGGLGVEWGVYEDTDKLGEGATEKILKTIAKLNPAKIRLMMNYDYFVSDFDSKGDNDKTNDTWSYNFANKWGDNMALLLSYCQAHHIEVALGAWNVVGDLSNDVWGMMDECTSDIRWAKMSGDVFDYLVNKKGFTCIRYFVNGNEPNYLGIAGSSKNANNTYAKWEQGVKNVRAALDQKGLTSIGIVGGDTTGFEGTSTYWKGIASGINDKVVDYGCHLYLSNYYIDSGLVLDQINALTSEMVKLDSGFGTKRPLDIWECGLLDGKNASTDSNTLIKTVSYGIRMADFTLQSVLGGFNSLVYWDFDDAMNFMYSGGIATPKRWGMFSSLASDQAFDQELRPWFHSSALLTNLLRRKSQIYGSTTNNSKTNKDFRCLGVVGMEGDPSGFVALNRGTKPLTKSFYFKDLSLSGEKLYIYRFGEGTLRLGEDGYLLPNEVIEGSLNKKLTLTLPANSLYVISTEAL
jgi:hypothetical protein